MHANTANVNNIEKLTVNYPVQRRFMIDRYEIAKVETLYIRYAAYKRCFEYCVKAAPS
jgi:hypothetical protein